MKNLRTIFATLVAGALAVSLAACGEAPKKATPKEDKKPVLIEINLENVAKACNLRISNNNGMKEIAMGMDADGFEIESDAFYKKATCMASIMAPDGVDYHKAINKLKANENKKDADHSLYAKRDGYELSIYAMGAKVNDGKNSRSFEFYSTKDRKAYFDRLNKEADEAIKSLKDAGDGSDHNDTND